MLKHFKISIDILINTYRHMEETCYSMEDWKELNQQIEKWDICPYKNNIHITFQRLWILPVCLDYILLKEKHVSTTKSLIYLQSKCSSEC